MLERGANVELDLVQLISVDRMPIASVLSSARIRLTWRELASLGCLNFGLDLAD